MAPLATLVGIALVAVAYPATVVALRRTDWLPPRFTPARLYAGAALQWALAVGVVGFVVVVEGRPLDSLGLAAVTVRDVLVAGVVVGGTAVVGSVAVQVAGLQDVDDAAVFLLAQPTRRKLALAVTAGVTEELVYRGYLLERTLEATASPALAAGLSLVAFVAAHLPGRPARSVLAQTLGVSVGLVVAYLLVRNVLVLAAVHAAVDALVLLSTDPADLLERVDPAAIDDRVLALVERS